MEKVAKVIIGWIVIVPVTLIFFSWISFVIPGGDGTAQLNITGFFLIAFLLWILIVDNNDKLQKLIDQKEVKKE